MGYKRTDALMRHLRDNGISIHGAKQKRGFLKKGDIPFQPKQSVVIVFLTSINNVYKMK